MTTTDFFRLIIKTFGVYCFVQALFSFLPGFSMTDTMFFTSIVINFTYILIFLIMAYLLLFQTNRFIKFLRLDKGFDNNTIDVKHMNAAILLKIAILILGLVLIANNLGQFLEYCFLAFKKEISAEGLDAGQTGMLEYSIDSGWWGVTGLNVLIGLLLILNHRGVAKLLSPKS
ncbi:MAG: hypothetical protein AAGL34_07870 [Bacteroidota bacterium]